MIKFLSVNLVATPEGRKILQVDVENSGDVWIRPEVYVELYDDKGATRGKYPGARYRLYPGTSVRQTIDVTAVPGGTYKALVVVDAGGENVFAGEYKLKF
jgi:hypothetical protein